MKAILNGKNFTLNVLENDIGQSHIMHEHWHTQGGFWALAPKKTLFKNLCSMYRRKKSDFSKLCLPIIPSSTSGKIYSIVSSKIRLNFSLQISTVQENSYI